MATVWQTVLGLYQDAEAAANAVDNLKRAGFSEADFDVLTSAPYPEGAFGEHLAPHRLFFFPLVGAACGFAVAILITVGTQLAYPLVTGGKPILSIPPMIIVMYEGTMLGAILFTVLGIIFESRLPRFKLGAYDPRIIEGYIGVLVGTTPDRLPVAEEALRRAGAVDIVHEEQRRR